MKRLLLFVVGMLTITLLSIAQASSSNSSSTRVELELRQTKEQPTKVHRSSRLAIVNAFYNEHSETLEISYDGEDSGEVFLYLNESIIDYSPEINTTFSLSTLGLYKVEVIGETWIASGYLQL